MLKQFTKANFIETEAEEDNIKQSQNPKTAKTEETSNETKKDIEDDNNSYGLEIKEENINENSKSLYIHRMLNQQESIKSELIIEKNLKRKRMPLVEKKNIKKKLKEHFEKKSSAIEKIAGIINGKLNIGFVENQKDKKELLEKEKSVNDEDSITKEFNRSLEEMKFNYEKKQIKEISKKNNDEFLKRVNENKKLIEKVIIPDEGLIVNKFKKSNNLKNSISRNFFGGFKHSFLKNNQNDKKNNNRLQNFFK